MNALTLFADVVPPPSFFLTVGGVFVFVASVFALGAIALAVWALRPRTPSTPPDVGDNPFES